MKEVEQPRRRIVIALGRSDTPPFPRSAFEDSDESPMRRSEEITAHAIGVVAYYDDPFEQNEEREVAEVMIWGDNIHGYEEAEEMKRYAVGRFPYLGEVSVFNNSRNTSNQADQIREEFSGLGEDVHITLITTIDQGTRAVRNLTAGGVRLDNVIDAHDPYVNEPFLTKKERERRKKDVAEVWINFPMYANMVGEALVNIVGLIDRKGKIPGWFAEKFRKSSKTEK